MSWVSAGSNDQAIKDPPIAVIAKSVRAPLMLATLHRPGDRLRTNDRTENPSRRAHKNETTGHPYPPGSRAPPLPVA